MIELTVAEAIKKAGGVRRYRPNAFDQAVAAIGAIRDYERVLASKIELSQSRQLCKLADEEYQRR
jgi:hypothetical protein